MKKIMLLPMLFLFSMWSYGQYCTPSFPSGCTDDHIDDFVIPAINFQHLGTGCLSGGYSDYSSDSSLQIVLEAGGTYEWSTTHGYGSQHVKIWVDANGDLVFDEALEEVDYAQSPSGFGFSVTEGEISIPSIFPPGTYRMRIATRYGSAPIPCNTAGYGEAHDYTVQILPPPTCLMPSNLTATIASMTAADISWDASTSAPSSGYEYAVTTSATPPASGTATTGTSVQGVAISQSVENYLHVRANCGGGDLSSWATYVFMGPTPGQIGYLEATGALPIQSCYAYNYSQQLFYANEVALAGNGNTYITKIRYYYDSAPSSGTANWDNWTVYMAHTSKTEFASDSDWVPGTDLIEVFSGNITIPAAGNWMEIELDNGFLWDGISNLVIAIDENVANYNCTAQFGVFNDPSQRGRTLLHYSDSVNADPLSPPTANGFYYTINALQLEATPPPSCLKPTQLAVTATTATTADVSWTVGDTETNWNISWGTPGYTPGDSNEINTGTTSGTPDFQITNLTPLTSYDVYVQADCGSGDLSVWEGPFNFTTAADCSIYTLSITANGDYVCDEGTATLTATASGGGEDIYWYDAAVGGNLLGIGNSFETPYITQTTSYWATEVVNGGPLAGQANANPTTFSNSTSNSGGLLFTVNNPIVIVDVEVFGTSTTGGDITIELRDIDNGNATIASTTATITGGGSTTSPIPHTIPLDFAVPAAGNYRLVKTAATASVGMGYVTAANSSFPYPLGNSGEVTGGATATGTSTWQYFFFNWTIKEAALCESVREEAVATVVTVEEVEASASTTQVDPGNSTTLTATSTNANYTYAWTWDSTTGGGTGTGTGATITVTPTAHTTYTVTATDSVTGCIATDEIEILVFDSSLCNTLDVTTTGAYVCDEGTAILTAVSSNTGDEIYWFDAAVGGNRVGSGTSFETPELTQTTSYWAAEVLLDGTTHFAQGHTGPTTLGSTTNGGITFTLTETASILDFEARSTSTAGGAVTYALIDVDNGNSVLMTHDDVLPGGGTATNPVLYTVNLNFNNIPPGNYRLIKQSGAASGYISGSFPYPLGTAGEVTTGAASATSTSTLNYHFFNITVDQAKVLCESPREEAIATVVTVEEVEASASTTQVDPGNSTTLTATSTNANYTYAWTWDSTTGGGTGTGTGATITVTPTAHTTYTVTATDSVTGCIATDEIEILVFNTALCNTLDITSTTDAYICDEGTAILTAVASTTGDEIYWYDAATGGNLVGKGASFETPFLTQTTSYWAAEVLEEGGLTSGQGKPTYSSATSGNSTSGSNWGLIFDAYEAFTIQDVEVYSTGGGGDITIQLQDNTGAMIDEVTVTLPGGGSPTSPVAYTAVLNMNVPAPGTYRLVRTTSNPATVNMIRESSSNTYPYPLGTVGSITSGYISGTSNTYYWFYNWTVSTAFPLCESDREEAVATVVTVEAVEASATDTKVDPGNSTTLTATSTNTNYTYAWTWDSTTGGGTGTGTGASITVTPSAHTTYTVTATDSVTGCIATDEIEILVFDTTLCNPLGITTTTGGYICDEGTVTLTATASGSGNDIYWYDAAVGGNLVGKGANFETPELTQTTSYWAAEVLQDIDVPSNTLPTYCTPTFTTGCTSSDTIDDFILEDSTNAVLISHLGTGCSPAGYGDYTGDASLQADLEAGETYSFSATHGTGSQYVRIWIDFDGNGSFEDAGELVYEATSAASSTVPTVGTFEIPSTISAINTVMRVKTTYSTGASNSCTQSGNWGEAHDYMVSISSVLNLCESPREEAIATVVNPEEVDITATDTQVDPGNSTTLTATSTNPNYTYAWTWDSATGGGTGTGTGASITVTPSVHTVYTVTATDSVTGCTTESEIQILVFNTADCISLDIVTTTGDIVCIGETADLTATASGTGSEIYWYDAAVGGNLVGRGANFETPPLTSTTSYWAAEALEEVSGPPLIEAVYTSGASTSLTVPAFITFAIENTNSFPIVLNGLDNYMPANTTRSYELWYHPTNLSGSPGTIDSANGWTLAVPEQTMTSGSSLDVVPVLENFEFTIPANTTWRFALVATANISGSSTFYYWNASASPNMFTDGGVNLLVHDHTAGGTGNVGYGSTNTPRGFRGALHFDNMITLCESAREEVIATVTSDAAPVGDATQNFIAGETLADLTVTGTNLTWYSDAAGTNVIPDTTLLVDATTYYVSQTINGCESQLLAITVTEVQPCDAPTNVVVGTLTTTTAEFSWTGSPHETDGYNWVVMEDGDDPLTDTPVDSGTTATGITTATATGLNDDTDYDFYVQTNCGAGNLSTWTGPVSFTTLGTPCIDPSALVISNITHDSADVSWTENGTATEWEIEYGLSGFTQGSGTVIVDNDGTLGETITGLDADESYDVYVRAICSSTNASVWVGPESFTTLEAPCIDPSAIVISNVSHDSADVSWTENGTATEWEIEYGLSGFTQGSGTVIVDNDGTLGETLTGLDADEDYDVYVRAICSSTNASAWVGPESFTTLVAPCADPSAIVISNVSHDSADVSWTENGTATEWEIEYGLSGFTQGSGTVIVDNDGTLGETITGLDADESYDVYVRAICSSTNASAWVGPESFITGSIGIADHDFSGFAYYPNPMDEVLNISSTNEMYEISIFNILGQKIVTHKMVSNTGTINVSHLASGSYMMQVMSETGQVMYVRLLKE